MTSLERIPVAIRRAAEAGLIERQARHPEQARSLDAERAEIEENYSTAMVELIGKTKYRNARPGHTELLARLGGSRMLFDPSREGLKAEEA